MSSIVLNSLWIYNNMHRIQVSIFILLNALILVQSPHCIFISIMQLMPGGNSGIKLFRVVVLIERRIKEVLLYSV